MSPDDEEAPAGDEAAEPPMEESPEGGPPTRARIPDIAKKEMFAIAEQLLGGSRIKVVCQDGKSRMARIPGKMKRRMWIREGDLLIVRPWDFQDEKCDVVYRYLKIQTQSLSRRGLLPKSLDVV